MHCSCMFGVNLSDVTAFKILLNMVANGEASFIVFR